MYVFFISAAVIAAMIIIILNITMLFEFSYGTGKYDTKIFIQLKYSLIKITLYPMKKDSKKSSKKSSEKNTKKDTKKKTDFSDFCQNITDIKNGYNILKEDIINVVDYLVKKGAIFKKIEFNAEFGLENACSTGIAYGIANAAVYGFLGFLHNTFTINEWNINLIPDFNSQHKDIYFLCIVKTRPKHIIKMFCSIIMMYMKYNKNLER